MDVYYSVRKMPCSLLQGTLQYETGNVKPKRCPLIQRRTTEHDFAAAVHVADIRYSRLFGGGGWNRLIREGSVGGA